MSTSREQMEARKERYLTRELGEKVLYICGLHSMFHGLVPVYEMFVAEPP